MRTYLLAVLLIACAFVTFAALRSHLRSKTRQQLRVAQQELNEGDWELAKSKADSSINFFSTNEDQQVAGVISAMADYQLFYLGVINVSQFSSAKTTLQKTWSSHPSYANAKYTLANDAFYHQHRFQEAEDLMQQGLASDPKHPKLLLLRLEILIASGRWVEGCEVLPMLDDRVSELERVRWIQIWSLSTFFPNRFLAQLDRRLGVLADDEQRNANSDLDRFNLFLKTQSDWTSCYAGLAQWYDERNLQELAFEQLENGAAAFQLRPAGVYLEQYLYLKKQASKKQRASLQMISSDARFAHASLLLDWDSSRDTWNNWPLRADQKLTRIRMDQFNDPIARENLTIQEKWLVEKRTELLEAIETDNMQDATPILAACWRDFGQVEFSEWIDAQPATALEESN